MNSNSEHVSASRLRWFSRLGFAALMACLVLSGSLGAADASDGRLINLSARAVAAEGADVLTAGFIITGSAPKRVLVRGAGPALGRLGVTGALAEVRLRLFRGSALQKENAGWDLGADSTLVSTTSKAVGAFDFSPASKDAALVVTLEPGSYSAQVSPASAGGAPGVALVEVYDADPTAASRLINLSAGARAGADAETLIVGFVVAGEGRNRMLVRGGGPALAGLGVTGAMADPQIELWQNGGSGGYNNDWQNNANPGQLADISQRAGAFAFAANSRDSALLLPAASGAYTALVSAATGGSGVALAEIYDTAPYPTLPTDRVFDLVGFGRVPGDGVTALTGGGIPLTDYNPVTRAGNYWRIDEATLATTGFAAQFQTALTSDTPLVVELNTMVDLSRFGRPNNGATAIAHPDLFTVGRTTGVVGTLPMGSNKTIYSAYGNGGFRRGSLSFQGKSNVILRNLKFRELWEWDDATGGEYDRNDWDYLTVTSATSGTAVTSRGHHFWIDHCDFEKSYDGLFDFVHGVDLITVSWCKVAGAFSGESARWVQRQVDYLEGHRSAFPYYNAQRATLSVADILREEAFQKKSNLVGNSADATTAAHDIGYLNVTFHHNWYVSVDQRMPRMRFGNAHVFNLLADSSAGRGVNGLALMGVAATSNGVVRLENSWFIDTRQPITNSAGTEPLGRVTVINSTNFDSPTQQDLGFDATRAVSLGSFTWNRPPAATGLGDWPQADGAVMPAGYVPTGRTLADYLDAKDYLAKHLDQVGVLVPADATEAAQLRARWQATTTSK